ncbi:hypothetical protein [Clostridium senegalense]|uniref:hypothetical protein n=1 Tax=Clostridium senegalense TaxID=1465809 RepID=UPI00028854F1|nr:hypothetical protein [Clostridium senegalense]
MTNKINNKANKNIAAVGNYTKNAVERFEENIVNQTDYLEKVKEGTSKNKEIEG